MATPLRAVRIPDELWNALVVTAKERDTTASDVIREQVQEWLDRA